MLCYNKFYHLSSSAELQSVNSRNVKISKPADVKLEDIAVDVSSTDSQSACQSDSQSGGSQNLTVLKNVSRGSSLASDDSLAR